MESNYRVERERVRLLCPTGVKLPPLKSAGDAIYSRPSNALAKISNRIN